MPWKLILLIGGCALVLAAALATVISGFSVPSWVLPFGALAGIIGAAL